MQAESSLNPTETAPDWPEELEPVEAVGSWTPPPEVNQHNGEPLPPEMVYFAPPPEEIGPVQTAYSTMKVGQRPKALVSRLLLGGAIGSAIAVGLSFAAADPVWQVVAGLVAFGLCWALTGYKKVVTYVGQEGLARLTTKGRPDRLAKSEVFRFDEAANLRTSQTRQYVNGVYSGTSYHFTWTDAANKRKFRLSGSYRGEKQPPKAKDPYHFALAAETAWSVHLFESLRPELEAKGCFHFPLTGQDWIEVGPGYFEFSRKGNRERWEAAEIGDVSISDGVFKLKRVDAKEGWFSKTGVFQFPYQQMANARLFLIALRNFLGFGF